MSMEPAEERKGMSYRRARLLIELPYFLLVLLILGKLFVRDYDDEFFAGLLAGFGVIYVVPGFLLCAAVERGYEARCFFRYGFALAAMGIVIYGGLS